MGQATWKLLSDQDGASCFWLVRACLYLFYLFIFLCVCMTVMMFVHCDRPRNMEKNGILDHDTVCWTYTCLCFVWIITRQLCNSSLNIYLMGQESFRFAFMQIVSAAG